MTLSSRSIRGWRSVLTAAALLVPATLVAQDPTEVIGEAVQGGAIEPETWVPDYAPDVPVPPSVLLGEPPVHHAPPIPEGPQVPGPDTPESVVVDELPQPKGSAAPEGHGAFRYFQNEPVEPSGASTSTVGEPSVAAVDDVVFETGNWYAARSIDNGSSFDYVSPYSFFSSVDGGFCCDQRMYYVASHDITVWLLQYSYSSSTQQGSYRLAVANGRADLANPSASAWTRYTLNPGNMGFGSGNWFDFPDVAVSDGRFWVSANVFSGGGGYTGSVVWAMNLDNMRDNVSTQFFYTTNSNLSGSTYRFAEGGSSRDRIYFAAMRNTSSIYVYRQTDTGSWSRVTRSVGSFSNGTASAPGPDGRDWLGRVTGRFRGAFGNNNEIGWMWTSAAQPTSNRPLPYTRVVRFTANDTRSKIAEHDIWSSSLAFAYGTARSSSRGHIGITIAYGGSNSHVRGGCTIIDQHQSWGGLTLFTFASGTSGPSRNRWGDYFDVHRHPEHTDTFIGTNMRQDGGSTNAFNEPRYLWFGRDDYEPTWVNIGVQSTGTNVSISQNVEDMSDNGGGTTPYSLRFAPRQNYELTAPNTQSSGGNVYLFEKWRYRVSPSGSFNSRPVGERTLSLNAGALDDTCIADYKIRRRVAVSTTNPSSGVTIGVSPDDFYGSGNGTTSFNRYYRDGERVTLTAPRSVGFNDFKRWVINGAPQRLPSRQITLNMSRDSTAVAEYYQNVAGSVRNLGAGCVGGNGLTPRQSVSWPSGQQGPQQGSRTTYALRDGPTNAGGVLHFGFDRNTWNRFRLPLDLSFLGMNGCTLYHDLVMSIGVTTDANGRHSVDITYPVAVNAIGTHVYTTYGLVDLGARRPTKVTHSNAIDLMIGGNR